VLKPVLHKGITTFKAATPKRFCSQQASISKFFRFSTGEKLETDFS
jgi:hypothetical protein